MLLYVFRGTCLGQAARVPRGEVPQLQRAGAHVEPRAGCRLSPPCRAADGASPHAEPWQWATQTRSTSFSP